MLWGCGWRAPFDRLRANGIARRDYGVMGVWVAGPLRQAQGERTRDGASRGLGWSESRIVLYGALGVRVAGPLTGSGRTDARRPFERLRRGFQFTLGELGVRARCASAGARLLTGAQLRDTVLQRQCRVASHVLLKGGGFLTRRRI